MWEQVCKTHPEESGQVGGHHDRPGHEEVFPEPAPPGRGRGVRLPLGFFLTPVGPRVDPVEKPLRGPGGQAVRDGEPAQRGALLQVVEAAGHEHQAG